VVIVKPLPPSQPFVAVSAESIEIVLQNIGMGHRMSRAELDEIVSEVGGDVTIPFDGERENVISANQMFDLIHWEDSTKARRVALLIDSFHFEEFYLNLRLRVTFIFGT
jgi:hypothetical protein